MLAEALRARLLAEDAEERVGLVLDDGTIIELRNVAADPKRAFAVRPEDMVAHEDRVRATWHTHPQPGATSLPSAADLEAFLMWPDLEHWIVSAGGARAYRVERGAVLCASS
jgi:proteasome lid subunit RPN8/RPN11